MCFLSSFARAPFLSLFSAFHLSNLFVSLTSEPFPLQHCPKEAFGFCCAYNHASDWFKWWAIEHGIVEAFAPYTKNCRGSGDSTWDVLKKLNDACGCTLNHEVKVDVTSDYYALRYFNPHNPKCH